MLDLEEEEDEDTWYEVEDSLSIPRHFRVVVGSVLIGGRVHLITMLEKACHRADSNVALRASTRSI